MPSRIQNFAVAEPDSSETCFVVMKKCLRNEAAQALNFNVI
jgi:hypothetical protein